MFKNLGLCLDFLAFFTHGVETSLGPNLGMNAFTRYVFGQLFVGMIFVTAGLTCIIWLSQSLRLVELIVNRGVSAGTFIYLTMLIATEFFNGNFADRIVLRGGIHIRETHY